jgi:hypothetical protein
MYPLLWFLMFLGVVMISDLLPDPKVSKVLEDRVIFMLAYYREYKTFLIYAKILPK